MTDILTLPTTEPGPSSMKSVTLYAKEEKIVADFSLNSGINNFSAALRMIINQWANAQPGATRADANN